MCGIAGLVAPMGPFGPTAEALTAMAETMHHRGPDDSGTWISPPFQRNGHRLLAGLAHRRLSILDLSPRGRQPMGNLDETSVVTFNGEIYNYLALRAELESLGYVFRTGTDTEVIIHGYTAWGDEVVRRLDGMFAFAFWDQARGRLLMARDRFGKKPLYYFHEQKSWGERLAFASELKAIITIPDFTPRVDRASLCRYLEFEHLPAPHCILEGVRKLRPGCMLSYDGAGLHEQPYWSLPSGLPALDIGMDEARTRLWDLLRDAVERRLMSDVPLGVFLSGGIDSSAVLAAMAETMPASKIKTFSIGFHEASFDESAYARTVAQSFGTDHKERRLAAGDMVDMLLDVIKYMDEPMADASVIPTFLLSKFTREHVTVALGGDGGDELLAGYDPFAALLPEAVAQAVPAPLRRLLLKAVGFLPPSERNMSLEFKIKQFLKGMEYDADVRPQVWLGAFSRDERLDLLSSDVRMETREVEPLAQVRAWRQGRTFGDRVEQLSHFFLQYYLPGMILVKVDMASMANSLEVRAPFLDTKLAEFANVLPSNFKLHGRERKHVLKRALAGKLPDSILHRPKKGFGIPLARWLKHELRPLLETMLNEERLRAEGLFNPTEVRRLMQEHFEGRRDNRKQLWTLLVFSLWQDSMLQRNASLINR